MKRVVSGLMFAAVVLVLTGAARGEEINPYRASAFVKDYELQLRKAGFRPDELRVHSIGQSHIDAAWRWRLAQTHRKVERTYGQAVEYIKRYPEFTFSGSSGQYYEWLLEEHPDIFRDIVELEKSGRWEIVGGMWVEPDCNMPGGESFARQFLLGQRFYQEHFGHMTEVSWMLDSFGYNRNLPQFAARSGCKYMWTSKLTWNDTTVFPFHNFMWRGPDGSEVLTHICPIVPLPTYFPFAELKKYKDTRYLLKPGVMLTANYATLPETIAAARSDDWLNVIGSFYGVGDGGLGPLEIEIDIQRALAQKGYTSFTTGLELFQEIEQAKDRLPVWDDEMYLEYHRGVQTTQAWIKRANRQAEAQIYTAEVLRSILQAFGVKYPMAELTKIWKRILLNHFHDILPGSSIPEVYDDAREDYKWIRNSTEDLKDAGLLELAKMVTVKPPAGQDGIVVFNSLAWQRSGLVRVAVPTGGPYEMSDASGAAVPCQLIDYEGRDYILFRAVDVPSMGYKTYFVKKVEHTAAEGGGPEIKDADTVISIENDLVKVVIDKEQGWVRELHDKKTGLQLIDGAANKLMSFYDRPTEYSAWNINKNYLEHPIEVPAADSITVTSRGPLYSEISVRREFNYLGKTTMFDQRIRLINGDPVVYLDINSDYHLPDSLTKLEFNTTLHSDTVTAENAYFMIERPAHPQTDAERAAWELPCQKWIDFSSPEAGLALLNNGKYGFSLNEDGTGYRMTLIKGARYPRANPGAKDVGHHFWTFPIPTGYTDQGEHYIELGLLPHAGNWRQAKLWEAGYGFNTPIEGHWTKAHDGELPAEGSFISLDSGSAMIGSVKRAEDDNDLVFRIVDVAGQGGSASLTFGSGLSASGAQETDLLEFNPTSGSTSLTMKPYEIKTLKVAVKK